MGRTTGQLKKMGMRMVMIQIMRRKALLPPHLTPKCSAHTESQSSTLTDTGHSSKLAGRGITMEYWEQVFLKQCGYLSEMLPWSHRLVRHSSYPECRHTRYFPHTIRAKRIFHSRIIFVAKYMTLNFCYVKKISDLFWFPETLWI